MTQLSPNNLSLELKLQFLGLLLSPANLKDSLSPEEVQQLISQIDDAHYVARATIFARRNFGPLSTIHLVAAILAKTVKGQSWMGKFLQDLVLRPDDITGILAAYINLFGSRPIPNMFKQSRGLSGAFTKFDREQLARYQGVVNGVSLKDAVLLLHPKPNHQNGLVAIKREDYWKTLPPKKKVGLTLDTWSPILNVPTLTALVLGLLPKLSEAKGEIVEDSICSHLLKVPGINHKQFIEKFHHYLEQKQNGPT